jgi:hypothetical protein
VLSLCASWLKINRGVRKEDAKIAETKYYFEYFLDLRLLRQPLKAMGKNCSARSFREAKVARGCVGGVSLYDRHLRQCISEMSLA